MMAKEEYKYGISRKQALNMTEVVGLYIKSMKLSCGLNTRRIFAAWDRASGASNYTINRYFRSGKLYITLSSSMIRSQLFLQKDLLKMKINQILDDDELYVQDDPLVWKVQEIILK